MTESPGSLTGQPALVVGESSEAAAVCRFLGREGVACTHAPTAASARSYLEHGGASVIVLDIDEDHAAAVGLCRHVKLDSATRLMPIVLLSDDRRKDHRLAGIDAGAEAVLIKPFDPDELLARVRAASRASQYASDLDSAAAIIMTVTAMIEARESSPGHCFRMANYATALGRAIQLRDTDLQALYRGAFLHDIGMLSIPDGILHKDGRLEPAEYEVIKSHPVIGDALCANLRTLHPVRPIVRHHHERLDGSGYPDRLCGDQVPLLAQIVSIVDLFEAMTMGRLYVAPRSAGEAIAVLRHETSIGWRQLELVESFAALVQSGALERFQGHAPDAPVGVSGLAADLAHAVASPATAAWGRAQ